MNERPKVGVAVYVMREGKFLMGKRLGAHGEGSWCVPGGHLEFGESIEDCARREVMEETGMKIKNIRFFGLTNDIFETENKHYITISMKADWDETEPSIEEPDKYVEQDWFTKDNLPEPLFLPLKNLIRQNVEL